METILKDRHAVIWDFDGVLYSYHFNDIPAEDLNDNFFSANARGAMEVIPELSYEDAYRIGSDSFLNFHDTLTGFFPYAEKLGLAEGVFKKKLLEAQLKWSFKHISENIPQLIAPCKETNELFSALEPYLQHVLITHANATHWARPVSRNLGVEGFFTAIYGYDDFDFQSKGKSAYAVDKALKTLSAESKNAIFVEDQLLHLKVAKEAYPDICCVFIEGPQPIDKPDYIDIMVKRPKDFMRVMLKQFQNQKDAA